MAKVESLILDFFSFSPFQSQNSMEAGPKCLRRYPWQSSRWQNIPDSMSLETNNCRSVYIYHLSMIFPMSTVCFFAGSWLQRNSFDSAPRDNDTVYTYILINQCTKLLQFCSIEQPSWPDSLFLMYYFASHYISLHFIYISPVDLFIFNMCRGEHIAFCKIHISAVWCVQKKLSILWIYSVYEWAYAFRGASTWTTDNRWERCAIYARAKLYFVWPEILIDSQFGQLSTE